MTKELKEFKCECCDYVASLKTNLLRHMERKHKNEGNNVTEVATPNVQSEEVASLKSEILALKAEIESLKMKHQIELLQQKCDLQNQYLQNTTLQNTIVSRRSPIKETIEPVKEPVEPVKESFRKKKAGENTLDYLNKFYDPSTYPVMYTEVCKGIAKTKLQLSMENINEQFAQILKPIITKQKLILHSGMDGRTHKIYYVNEEHEWVESITYLTDVTYEMEENNHQNIYDLIYQKYLKLLIEVTQSNLGMEDNLEYITLYNKPYDAKQIITLMIDGMNLPDDDE
jgi:hypothetical protein